MGEEDGRVFLQAECHGDSHRHFLPNYVSELGSEMFHAVLSAAPWYFFDALDQAAGRREALGPEEHDDRPLLDLDDVQLAVFEDAIAGMLYRDFADEPRGGVTMLLRRHEGVVRAWILVREEQTQREAGE